MIRSKHVESFKEPIMPPYTKTVFKEDIRCKILHQANSTTVYVNQTNAQNTQIFLLRPTICTLKLIWYYTEL